MGMVSLDISKTYDSSWKPLIIKNLKKILSVGQLYNFICNFLDTRTFQVKINNSLSDVFEPLNEVPQGLSLSPTVFLIAINSIINCIKLAVKTTLYADNLNFFYSSNKIETVQMLLRKSDDNLSKLSKNTGFNFSPEKSQCIVFTYNLKKTGLNLKMEYQQITKKKKYN